MFTRSTPQRAQGGNQQFQGQNNYNQGNYQSGNKNQQTPYKQQANNTPYKQQPQQQTQQPQTPQQQLRQPAAKTPAAQTQQQQQQQGGAAQQRLKPILKTAAPAVTNNQTQNQGQNQVQAQNQKQQQPPVQQQPQQQQTNNGVDPESQEKMETTENQDVPRWKRKIPGLKVNRKLKRLRMNQRLRKTLQPKNAIMVLNEMRSGVQYTFPESSPNLPHSLFLVHVEVDGKTYVGQGLSKLLARQNAAENALKSLLLEKMNAAAAKARLDSENEGSVASQSEGEAKEGGEAMETSNDDADEIPWSSLASFALYKLFLEWQNQGTVVPVPRPGLSPGKVKKETIKPANPKELPPNALSVHPVMLLNQMRPGVTYNEISRVGNPPNTMFTLATEIDGQEFVGTAKNKKDAKKIAAKAALQTLFNLVYPEEKEEDVPMA